MKHLLLYCLCLLAPLQGHAQTNHFDFDMTRPQPRYTDATGYGYDITASPVKGGNAPFFFSVKVPDGNYRISVTLGSRSHAAVTTVRAENRRLMVEPTATRRREQQTVTFVVNKRSPRIDDRHSVRIKDRERDYLHWDDRLTLEFNGTQPAVSRIVIDPDTTATTVFLCGNSTVVDQSREPWASWGQMIPHWWDDQVAVCNLAESGLTAGSFLAQGRLDYITAHMRPGDYVFCEFDTTTRRSAAQGPAHGTTSATTSRSSSTACGRWAAPSSSAHPPSGAPSTMTTSTSWRPTATIPTPCAPWRAARACRSSSCTT